jgi:hypothetical protein
MNGVIGHRIMRVFLARKNIYLSKTTIHKYMNKQLGLKSIVRRKKPGYVKRKAHKIFSNLLHQDFTAESKNSNNRFSFIVIRGRNLVQWSLFLSASR